MSPAPFLAATAAATAIADWFADILRGPGDLIRNALLAIDLAVAKGIFLAYFTLLIVWVLTLSRDDVAVPNPRTGRVVSLRPYALAALISQWIIYLVF